MAVILHPLIQAALRMLLVHTSEHQSIIGSLSDPPWARVVTVSLVIAPDVTLKL